jgi:hypothetical protein
MRPARAVIVLVIIDVIVCVTVRTVCAADGEVDLVAPLTSTVFIGLLVKLGLVVEVATVIKVETVVNAGTVVKIGLVVEVLNVVIVRLTDDA